MFARMQRFGLAVYGLGVGTSQSLMSLMGGLFSLGGAVVAVRVLIDERRDWQTRLCTVAALSWLLFMVLNLLLREWQPRSLHTLGHLPYVLIPLSAFASTQLSPRASHFVFGACGLAVFAASGLALYQYFFLGSVALGLMKNPIYFAYNIFPAFLFFAELSQRHHASMRLRLFLWATAFAALIGILLSENRMAWLCTALYLVVRGLPLLRRRWGVKSLWAAAALSLVVIFALYQSQDRFREKFERSFSSQDPSRVWRFKAWTHNLALFRAHPIVGVGPERNAIDVDKSPELQGHWLPGRLYFAHSVYIQSLADSGIVGTTLLFAFLTLFGLCFPGAQIYLLFMGFMALTENIFNNSRAAHAFYFFLLLSAVGLKKEEAPIGSTR